MLPIAVDLGRVRVVLVGNGLAACRRLGLLTEAGAELLEVYAPEPCANLVSLAGAGLQRRLPRAAELRRAQLIYLAGLDAPTTSRLRHAAERAGVLLNSEDDIAHSDFHSTAVVRRGALTVAISTSGRSPGLAAAIRRHIEQSFGAEWENRLEQIGALRSAWRSSGDGAMAIARQTADWFELQRPHVARLK